MSVDLTSHTRRLIDAAFLDGVAQSDERYVREIRPEREQERARVDIEIVSEPYLDIPDDSIEDATTQGLAGAFVKRWEKLRAPFGEQARPDLLVVRGRSRLEPAPGAEPLDSEIATRVWDATFERIASRTRAILDVREEAHATAGDVAAVFVVKPPLDDPRPELPLAVLAVVGVLGDEDGASIERLLDRLTGTIARNVPLHVIAVGSRAEVEPALMARCKRLRIGLVLTAAGEEEDVVTLSRTTIESGQSSTEVALVRCPAFKSGVGTPGLTRVRVDMFRGEAAIAFHHDLGSDRSHEPIQVMRPLPTVSRVSNSERRLYSRVRQLLRPALAAEPETASPGPLQRFSAHVEQTWTDSGYAALCDDDGAVPLGKTRHASYNLLLLLRERNGGYDMLLSNHSPMRRSPLSDWNVLLLPAFSGVRGLLEHLRDDVVRQVTERAEDYERAAHAESFERAVNRILSDREQFGDDLWADKLREVATRKIRKISPTTGAVTEFTYHLVTLLPLIERRVTTPIETSGGADQAAQRNDERRIVEWLKGLDTIRVPGESSNDTRGMPIEAFWEGGAGLRWDPEALLGEEEPFGTARRRSTQAYPGAIWFPLAKHGEPALWRECPAIVARNVDVMSWVDEELASRRRADSSLPEQLLLGRYAGGADEYSVELAYPFEGALTSQREREDDSAENDVPARSTVEALSLVQLNSSFDLGEERAYANATFMRVWLLRGPVSIDRPRKNGPRSSTIVREAIYVYPAEQDERAFDPALSARKPLGLLRPVQRYVLRAGLERVDALDRAVRDYLDREGVEPWGFTRVRKGGAPNRVSVTPPIIEQLHEEDWAAPLLGEDFIVCDGNHRIVQLVWRWKRALAAVAVIGDLAYPYYARPFGALEWEATSDNELVVAPDTASKYLVRQVTDAEVLEEFKGSEPQLYRRYFRNLETGFGPLGGQGGRFA